MSYASLKVIFPGWYTIEVGVECLQGDGKIHILSPLLTLAGKASSRMVVYRVTGITVVDWVMGSVYV